MHSAADHEVAVDGVRAVDNAVGAVVVERDRELAAGALVVGALAAGVLAVDA